MEEKKSQNKSNMLISAEIILPTVFIVALFAMMIPGIITVIQNQSTIVDGPQSSESQELWEYINTNTKKDEIIVFRKLFALHLYTGRTSHIIIPFGEDSNIDEITKAYQSYLVSYFVVDTAVENDARELWLDNYVKNNDLLEIIWENERFQIYAWIAN